MSGIPQSVLSQELSDALSARRVLACVFTTFSFDPGFFELEILQGLFDRPFSRIDKVRRIQLEEALRETDVAVYYDRGGLVADAQPASLDFRRFDVHRHTGCFHSKLVLALVENVPDEEGDEPEHSLVVAVLSANLTRSGWWENVETGHMEEVRAARSRRDRCTFRKDLLDLTRKVRAQCSRDEEHIALERIEKFLRNEAPKRENAHTASKQRLFTRIFAGQEHLADWLAERRLKRFNYHLEVISPFFDKLGAKALHRLIDTLAPDEVRVLLPIGFDGKPDISKEQYDAIAAVATWSRLPSALTRSGPKGHNEKTPPRRVHAKVFRFWRRGAGEVIVAGSANLTEAGCGSSRSGNLEASFLIDATDAGYGGQWLLEPLEEAPVAFREQATTEIDEGERVGALLSLRFDWVSKRLSWRLDEEFDGRVELRKLSGELLLEFEGDVHGAWVDCGDVASEEVLALLSSTSMLSARSLPRGKAKVNQWRVLIREEDMSFKPTLLRQLSPEEILLYWSLLSPEQQEAFLVEKLGVEAQLEGLAAGRGTRYRTEDTLFDRFAGLYHAFEQVRRMVDRALSEGNSREAEALLFGAKYDSLPELLRGVRERSLCGGGESTGDPVHAYVTFLCAQKLTDTVRREHPGFWLASKELHHELQSELGHLCELRSTIPDLDGQGEFLAWYEESFLADVETLEGQAK